MSAPRTQPSHLPLDGRPLLLLLDFDGTLVPIAPHPDAIRVPVALPQVLRALQNEGQTVRIVTGRAAGEVERRVPGAVVIGLHGLQWPGEPLPGKDPALDEAKREAETLARRFPGILVEDKRISLALHYRQVPPELHAQAMQACHRLAERVTSRAPALSIIEGHELVEIRPREASKGRAIQRLVREHPDHQPVYIGDDTTDEEAFAALPPQGIAIRVGPDGVQTRAPHRLADVDAVYQLLGTLSRGVVSP